MMILCSFYKFKQRLSCQESILLLRQHSLTESSRLFSMWMIKKKYGCPCLIIIFHMISICYEFFARTLSVKIIDSIYSEDIGKPIIIHWTITSLISYEWIDLLMFPKDDRKISLWCLYSSITSCGESQASERKFDNMNYYFANILSVYQFVDFPYEKQRAISLRCSWWSNRWWIILLGQQLQTESIVFLEIM